MSENISIISEDEIQHQNNLRMECLHAASKTSKNEHEIIATAARFYMWVYPTCKAELVDLEKERNVRSR